jgi:hypothetical protein
MVSARTAFIKIPVWSLRIMGNHRGGIRPVLAISACSLSTQSAQRLGQQIITQSHTHQVIVNTKTKVAKSMTFLFIRQREA